MKFNYSNQVLLKIIEKCSIFCDKEQGEFSVSLSDAQNERMVLLTALVTLPVRLVVYRLHLLLDIFLIIFHVCSFIFWSSVDPWLFDVCVYDFISLTLALHFLGVSCYVNYQRLGTSFDLLMHSGY